MIWSVVGCWLSVAKRNAGGLILLNCGRDFFDNYSRLIRGVAIKSGLTEAETEDVVQETIISVSQIPDLAELYARHSSGRSRESAKWFALLDEGV